jgi:hypothetical protein
VRGSNGSFVADGEERIMVSDLAFVETKDVITIVDCAHI